MVRMSRQIAGQTMLGRLRLGQWQAKSGKVIFGH